MEMPGIRMNGSKVDGHTIVTHGTVEGTGKKVAKIPLLSVFFCFGVPKNVSMCEHVKQL